MDGRRFDKTTQGHEEITQGRKTLRGKLRTVLFLVDTSKTADAIQQQIQSIGAPPDALAQLEAAGYIRAVESPGAGRAVRTLAGPVPTRPAPIEPAPSEAEPIETAPTESTATELDVNRIRVGLERCPSKLSRGQSFHERDGRRCARHSRICFHAANGTLYHAGRSRGPAASLRGCAVEKARYACRECVGRARKGACKRGSILTGSIQHRLHSSLCLSDAWPTQRGAFKNIGTSYDGYCGNFRSDMPRCKRSRRSPRSVRSPIRPQAADARGFAWFWAFLASVAIVLGLLSWWVARTQKDEDA